jgi:hypothetical protein
MSKDSTATLCLDGDVRNLERLVGPVSKSFGPGTPVFNRVTLFPFGATRLF